MGDGFYRSKDPTNSIKVLKENPVLVDFYFQFKYVVNRSQHYSHWFDCT